MKLSGNGGFYLDFDFNKRKNQTKFAKNLAEIKEGKEQ